MTMTKTIIGLTGNIATGKSVVRRMLTNMGALGLDADVIAHRLYYKTGPAYKQVIDAFGPTILTEDGEISRQKLGKIAFSDTDKLHTLEGILHPLVTEEIHKYVDQSQTPIIAVEAIKLFEAGLDQHCDQVWVSHASAETQMARLMQARNMTKQEAALRLASQTSQIEKRNQADVVINTEGSFFDTWQQIIRALNDTIQVQNDQFSLNLNTSHRLVVQPAGSIPGQRLAAFWLKQTHQNLADLYEQLGLKLMTVVQKKKVIKGMAIWEEWNFTAILKQIITARKALELADEILEAYEGHSQMQQSEILLIPQNLLQTFNLNPSALGYQYEPVDELISPAWRTAGQTMTHGQSEKVWIKILPQSDKDLAQMEKN